MLKGTFTALVTPFEDGEVDYEGLDRLSRFQIENGITGILAVGTTGESPTLSWDEHNKVIEAVRNISKDKCLCIAGTGSNNTKEAVAATKHASEIGVDAVLLVDPYYNGPSSQEIRREYYAPVASAFPDMDIIPYVIPGRTGAQLFPEDLALLNRDFRNVNTVKEATANLNNMKRTRECCGSDFTILSGDDGMTFQMMTDAGIKAAGVISVASNIAPKAVSEMIRLLHEGHHDEAEKLKSGLAPLFGLVTVTTKEQSPYGEVTCRARNPLAAKTLMSVLGMPAGGTRQPIGKMTKQGLDTVLGAGRKVWEETPEILKPIGEFFGVDINERLNTPANWEGLCYTAY